MAQRDRVGMKPVHHRSLARSRLAKLTLPSPSLIEFLGHNPEPVRGSKIARQTERRRMYPWRGAPNCDFDRSCRIIDDPLKPEEALSDAQRQAANEWYDHTLYSRQNDKQHGAIVIIMQRLHEDDLIGHVLGQEPWKVVSFPAIAEADEVHEIETIWGPLCFTRRQGEASHPDREPLATLDRIRRTIGEYNFAGQYQQSPAPLGGGLVKAEWFKRYRENERPERFERTVQSWDTANKATELSDFSVCTTWGVRASTSSSSMCSADGSSIQRSSVPCASSRACSMPPSC